MKKYFFDACAGIGGFALGAQEGFLPLLEESEQENSLMGFCRIFSEAGMMRNGKLYRLRKSVRHILESVFGSSVTQIMRGGGGLYWRTPDANMERGKRSYENMKMRIDEGKPLNLNDQLNAISKGLLPTPQSRDFRSGQAERIGMKGKQKNLNDYVKLWPSPRAGNPGSRPNGKGGKILAEEVKKSLFPTPTVQDYKHRGPNSRQRGLADVVRPWATPTANDAKNSISKSQVKRGPLTAHLAENEETLGGQLNAEFVEWLMGYPLGYTDIENDIAIGGNNGKAVNTSGEETLFSLWEGIRAQTDQRKAGRQGCVQEAEILQPEMLWQGNKEKESYKERIAKTGGKIPKRELRNVQHNGKFTDTSCGRESKEYGQKELDDALRFLPYKMALGSWEDYTPEEQEWLTTYIQTGNRWHSEWHNIPRIITGQKNRVKRLKGLGNSVVPLIPMMIWLLIKEVLITNRGHE